jgi:anti-sigma factor RsiW
VSRGFNVVHWADGSMQYWAVSDVEGAELLRFAEMWQVRAAAQ